MKADSRCQARLRLCRSNSRIRKRRVTPWIRLRSESNLICKNQISRCDALRSLDSYCNTENGRCCFQWFRWRVVHCADGNHRVPNVNRNSDGSWKFNLGNFENQWNSNNCLVCFCHLFGFLPLPLSGSFFCQTFLPTAEHPTHFIKSHGQLAI